MNTHLVPVFAFIADNLNFRVFSKSNKAATTTLSRKWKKGLCLLALPGERSKDTLSINVFLTMLIHYKDRDLHFRYMEWYESHERTPTNTLCFNLYKNT